jgi:hypothetical protein
MRHDDIPDDLRRLAFDFFYWFSRFEFALKEARFLKSKEAGAKAEADWNAFIARYSSLYQVTPIGQALIDAKPQRQIVSTTSLDFRDVGFNPGASDLERVVRLANTVRNNLFHGGKHGSEYWDQPARMQALLSTTIKVLDELADMAGLQSEYHRYY